MVESFYEQGFVCLRGGKKMKKRGFRNRTAAPRKLGLTKTGGRCDPLYIRMLTRVAGHCLAIQDDQTTAAFARSH
jgi:hypothetical protein